MQRGLTSLLLIVSLAASLPADQPDFPGTFSILGYDPATGEIGGAVQSRVFSVGNGVLWAEADAGVAATQAIVDVSYGPKALALLRRGVKPDAIVKQILDGDPDPGLNGRPWPKAGRQFAVMDAKGNYAAHTGPEATKWAGHKKGGKFCTTTRLALFSHRSRAAVVAEGVAAFGRRRRWSSSTRLRVVATIVPAAMWVAVVVALAATGGVAWSAHLLGGALVVAASIGGAGRPPGDASCAGRGSLKGDHGSAAA